MKSELMITMGAFLALALRAQLMPLPDMSSSKVPTVRDAEDIVTKHILASPDDGLSATETIVGKLSFALGVDISRFGKKGDRVWQVHRVSFAKTTSIIWVNAETTLMHVVFPEKKLNVEPGNPPKPHSPSAQGAGSRYQPDYAKWQSITNGMTKDEVRAMLGDPVPFGGNDRGSALICNPWRYGRVAHGCDFDVWFRDDRVMGTEDPFDGNFSTNGIPTTPVLIYPHTNMVFTHYPRVVDFRWYPSSGEYPIEYQLYAGSGSVFTFEPHGTSWMSGMGTHRWRVRAINRLGVSPWSEWRQIEFTR